MKNVTEIQQRLQALGYLAPGEDDGKFGAKSLDAYNHWRASKGAPPINAASMSQLNQDLFPEEQPGAKPRLTPNPVVQAIGRVAIDILLQRLTKGAISMTFLTGYKTFIIGGALILLGGLSLIGWSIPGVPLDQSQGLPMIMSGLGLITGRVGAKTEAAKVSG
jgi:peptidoglycan hydrolase-like protein with peptidoglycan-binding domain